MVRETLANGGRGGEAHLQPLLAGCQAETQGDIGLAGAAQANDRLPAFRDLRFGFVIRFILVLGKLCRWSRGLVMAGPPI